MSFKVPKTSFILKRRRRSIRLCWVLRATFLLAAVFPFGCFRLFPAGVAFPLPEAAALELVVETGGLADVAGSWLPGFIWMIFLARVGGGGSAQSLSTAAARVGFDRFLGTGVVGATGEVGDGG
jgi:hypothetical protein